MIAYILVVLYVAGLVVGVMFGSAVFKRVKNPWLRFGALLVAWLVGQMFIILNFAIYHYEYLGLAENNTGATPGVEFGAGYMMGMIIASLGHTYKNRAARNAETTAEENPAPF